MAGIDLIKLQRLNVYLSFHIAECYLGVVGRDGLDFHENPVDRSDDFLVFSFVKATEATHVHVIVCNMLGDLQAGVRQAG
jgi:hypothetical protein